MSPVLTCPLKDTKMFVLFVAMLPLCLRTHACCPIMSKPGFMCAQAGRVQRAIAEMRVGGRGVLVRGSSGT